MAKNTNINLRNKVMYSIYLRNHTEEGTFAAAEKDLDRIKMLGTDIIWLMPIHPIGQKNKKGTLGCPYAIKDYRAINSEYGDKKDLIHFVEQVHARGMLCIIDVVYNHTSPDSVLAIEHPEFFYKKEDGSFGNKTGEWFDVIDLDYSNKKLWEYQIETLYMWAKIVDGFRCDVASLIPIEFWENARREVAKVNPQAIWLAESIDMGFIRDNRRRGLVAHSDSEVFGAFDVLYDYDMFPHYSEYLRGDISLDTYVRYLNFQDNIYPANYVKLRCLENHDQPRAKSVITDEVRLINWTAFEYFQKGMTLVYAGQEMEDDKLPSLFDKDLINWNTGKNISKLLAVLSEIKKMKIMSCGDYHLEADKKSDTIIGTYEYMAERLIGIFCLKGESCSVSIELEDGDYSNLINGEILTVKDRTINVEGRPIILKQGRIKE